MSIFHMSDELMARVAAQARSGRSLQEIAAEHQISLEMAATAARKWPLIERLQNTYTL
jgi:hypothetical protein